MSEIQKAGGPALAKLVLLSVDLAGYARWAACREALEIAAMLDRYYTVTTEVLERHGGRVVKFMGDGVFATFADAMCIDAIAAGRDLLSIDIGEPQLRPGVAIHVAQVAAGEIGPPAHRQWDIVGVGVNHLFRMGGGPGLRLSEPAYRRLPNDARGGFRKDEPPATYHLMAPPRAAG
jgi:adenylate cyclase